MDLTLALILATSTPLTWYSQRDKDLEDRRERVEQFVDAGAHVFYSDFEESGRLGAPTPACVRREYLGQLFFGDNRAFVEVYGVIVFRRFTDDDLLMVRHFPHLRFIQVEPGKVSERGLAHLVHVPHLEALYIPQIMVATDSGVDRIAECGHLKELVISAETPAERTKQLRDRLPGDCKLRLSRIVRIQDGVQREEIIDYSNTPE